MDVISADPLVKPSDPPAAKSARIPIPLYVLFFASGSSGLIYEVVWLRMLTRTLGSTVYATSTILAVFMGGLALGSFLFGRLADKVRRPLLLYVALEAGIGLTALLSLGMNSWPVPLYREIYAFAGGSRAALTLGQIFLAIVALLLPTTLMGATLPTLCAYGGRRSHTMGRVVGTLYALNTLGAMVGVLVSGYILIGWIGETRTIIVGAVINGLVALSALYLAPADASSHPEPSPAPTPLTSATISIPSAEIAAARRVRLVVLFCFATSGFVSLALEIIWSRLLTLYLGTSIYAFTSMLAVMLAGIGVGGWYGGRVERWKDPLLVLARLQMGIAFFAAMGLVAFAYLDNAFHSIAALVVVGPTALLLGIAFPVTVRCYTEHAAAIGRRVGELYAWNTVGCIAGSLAGGFVLVPLFGTGGSGAVLARLAGVSAVAVLAVRPRGRRGIHVMDVAFLGAVVLATMFIGDPFRSVVYRRTSAKGNEVFAHIEAAGSTTTATGRTTVALRRELLINGVGMTLLITGNKLMAHLPLWLSDSPHDALVICLGMGTTFRSAVHHADIDVTAVEIVRAVPTVMRYYHNDADQVMAQPNAHIVIDDGRNYLLMHPRQFDLITIDPAPPLYSAGTVNLYTKEFFELCMTRLRPHGVICLWVPPAELTESKMILRTFATVFSYVSVWAGPTIPGFYVIGTLRPVEDVAARVRKGFTDPDIVADLTQWDGSCRTPERVLALHLGDRDDLLRFTSDSPVLTDDRPYTEFPYWRLDMYDSRQQPILDAPYFRQWLQSHR